MWKSIPTWEGSYEAHTDGRVRSLDFKTAQQTRKGRELIQHMKAWRYLAVTLSRGERRKQYFVHDLVAATFLGEKPEGAVVRHLDGDRYNNRADNLAYGTHADNMRDRNAHGRTARGGKHGMAKLTDGQVKYIKQSTLTNKDLAFELGVSSNAIWAVRAGLTWKQAMDNIKEVRNGTPRS